MNSKCCENCGGSDYRTFALEGRYEQCRTCGLVCLKREHWPHNQEEHYSDTYYAADYTPTADRSAPFAYRFKILKQELPPPGALLEVGAAGGGFLDLARDAGYQVSGVELSSRAVAAAQKAYGLSLFQGTLEQAAFPEASFDYVVSYHVLEHMPHPAAALAEMCRVLKPGGRLLIEVPNIASIDMRSRALRASILHYPHHLYGFSPETLKSMIHAAGFSAVTISPSVPFTLAGLLAGLRRRRTRDSAEPEKHGRRGENGREMLARSRPDGFVKRLVARLMPGMKMTIVARK